MFLGIFRGTEIPRNIPTEESSSEFSEGQKFLGIFRYTFRGIFRRNFRGLDHRNSIEIFRGRRPSVYSEEPSDELCVLGVSSEFCFLGIPSEISDGIPRKYDFPRRYFRRLVSSVCPRNSVISTTYRRFFPSVCGCFLVVVGND